MEKSDCITLLLEQHTYMVLSIKKKETSQCQTEFLCFILTSSHLREKTIVFLYNNTMKIISGKSCLHIGQSL